jgi:hypothetical protein
MAAHPSPRDRLKGNPEQRVQKFTQTQRDYLATLSASNQSILKKQGFGTRPQIVRVGSPAASTFKVGRFPATSGFAIRAREGAKTTRTGFVAGTGLSGFDRLTGAAGKELARHEITHQVLAPQNLTVGQEHAIIDPNKEKRKRLTGLGNRIRSGR